MKERPFPNRGTVRTCLPMDHPENKDEPTTRNKTQETDEDTEKE